MNDRAAYIDNLRIMVNGLIVLNHSIWNRSLENAFTAAEMELVELLRFISMNWSPIRVPFFFLIAGLFTATFLTKHGAGKFAQTRVKRIVLPLVVALFTYTYLVVTISKYSDITLLWSLETYRDHVLNGFNGFGYVWFLYVLIVYSLVALITYLAASKFSVLALLIRRMSKFLCMNRYVFLFALLCAEGARFVFVHGFPGGIPDDLPFIPFGNLISNLSYFCIGALAGLSFRDFQNNIRFTLPEVIVIVSIYGAFGVAGYIHGIHSAFQLFSVLSNAIPLVMILSLFNQYLNKRVSRLSVVMNSTYTIYLIHFPIICLLSYGLLHMQLPTMQVYFLVILVAYPLSLSSALLIRRVPPLAFLFGAKPLYRFRRSAP